ncbi:MAG: hypothetical protein ACPGOY_12885 [Rhodospirillaceae bacterium]
MDGRQDINLGGTAGAVAQELQQQVASQKTGANNAPSAQPPQASPVGGASTSGSNLSGQQQQTPQPNTSIVGSPPEPSANPRTVLDQETLSNVSQFTLGDVEFQVPSRAQLVAYRRSQEAEAEQQAAEQRAAAAARAQETEVQTTNVERAEGTPGTETGTGGEVEASVGGGDTGNAAELTGTAGAAVAASAVQASGAAQQGGQTTAQQRAVDARPRTATVNLDA